MEAKEQLKALYDYPEQAVAYAGAINSDPFNVSVCCGLGCHKKHQICTSNSMGSSKFGINTTSVA